MSSKPHCNAQRKVMGYAASYKMFRLQYAYVRLRSSAIIESVLHAVDTLRDSYQMWYKFFI